MKLKLLYLLIIGALTAFSVPDSNETEPIQTVLLTPEQSEVYDKILECDEQIESLTNCRDSLLLLLPECTGIAHTATAILFNGIGSDSSNIKPLRAEPFAAKGLSTNRTDQGVTNGGKSIAASKKFANPNTSHLPEERTAYTPAFQSVW